MDATFVNLLPSVITVVLVGGGGVMTFVKLKSMAVTNHQCEKKQKDCISHLSGQIRELKSLVIDLHKDQSEKIASMDKKRESAKETTSAQMLNITLAIGRIEGRLTSDRRGSE